MANFPVNYRQFLQRIRPLLQRRFVSTSKKNNETVAADIYKSNAKSVEKNWVSYGFDFKNKADDRASMHGVFFAGVSLCLVVGGFSLAYAPDYGLRDWAVREAFLELRRREASGAPLMDPDFIPADKIVLPSDEELGDTEIII